MWFFTFGFPTSVFLVITLLTLWYSLANVAFQLPTWAVQVRGLAAYWYGIASLLYIRLGRPQEVQRLREKDATIAALHTQYHEEMARIRAELSQVYEQLESAVGEKKALSTALHQSSHDVLQAYGEECVQWLNGLEKTVSVDAIAAHTGIKKRRLQTAIDKKELRIRGTNKELVWTPSLREYLLKNAPKSQEKMRRTDGMPALHLVNE